MYYTCLHCRFVIPEDDVWLELPDEKAVCLKCAMRLADDTKEMSKDLRKQVYEVLSGITGG